jgi:hypothetical protein
MKVHQSFHEGKQFRRTNARTFKLVAKNNHAARQTHDEYVQPSQHPQPEVQLKKPPAQAELFRTK